MAKKAAAKKAFVPFRLQKKGDKTAAQKTGSVMASVKGKKAKMKKAC